MASALPRSSPLFTFTEGHRAYTLLAAQRAYLNRHPNRQLPSYLVKHSTPRTAADAVFANDALLALIDAFIPLSDLFPPPDHPPPITVRRSPRLKKARSLQEFAIREHRGIYYSIPLYESSPTRPVGWDILPPDYFPGYYDSD